jgi:hypothetical protein
LSILGLSFINESINDSVLSAQTLHEENKIDGIVELAKLRASKGVAYIDVKDSSHTPVFMAEVVRKIQKHISILFSIDIPDPEIEWSRCYYACNVVFFLRYCSKLNFNK